MNVATILKAKGHDVESIGPDVTLGDAVRVLGAKRIGAVLVMQGAQLVGILSERDIVKTLAHSGAEALDRKVRDTMTSRLVTCGLNDSVDQLMDMMTEGRFRHLPVVDDGKLVGVISIGDVVKHRIAETVMETEALKLYIANS